MFNLFGLRIHLYGLLIGIGIWVALEMALTRQKKTAEKKVVESVFGWAVLGGVVGARAYHVIDYWQRYYSQNLIKIFYLWEGGLGIWGAIIGGMLAIYIYCRVKEINFLQTLDSLIIGVPLAQAIGRLGNFVNGELYGKNGEPLFAYEAGLNMVLFGVMWWSTKTKRRGGWLTGLYLAGYGMIRILLEGLRPDAIIWRIGGVPTAMIFGVVAVVVGIYFIFRRRF